MDSCQGQRYLDHIAPKDLIDTMQRREWAV